MRNLLDCILINNFHLRSEKFLVIAAGYARSVFSPQQSMKLSDGISSFITPWHYFLTILFLGVLSKNAT